MEIQRLLNNIEQERIKEAEVAIIKAQLEAKKLAEIAEREIIEKERKEKQQKKLQEFKKEYPNLSIDNYEELENFIRIKDIIVELIIEQLEVDKKQVTLDAHIKHDLGASELLDGLEIIIAIEKQFNIKISEGQYKNLLC